MLDTTTFVGLDVHARSIKAVSLDVMTGEVRAATFGYDAGAVAEWVRSVDPKARCVYESGVTGFDLQKRLSGLGVDCVVGAVSKMIKPSADRRRKNGRNDAEFLARMLSVGNVVGVWVPDDECEAARDLTRALEDARDDLSRAKQRLSKFLLRHGRPPHISRSPRKRFDPKPLRRTSGPLFASAQRATRVHRLSVRRRSLSRSNGLPSERSPRADNKLRRRASGRHAEVAADGLV